MLENKSTITTIASSRQIQKNECKVKQKNILQFSSVPLLMTDGTDFGVWQAASNKRAQWK